MNAVWFSALWSVWLRFLESAWSPLAVRFFELHEKVSLVCFLSLISDFGQANLAALVVCRVLTMYDFLVRPVIPHPFPSPAIHSTVLTCVDPE